MRRPRDATLLHHEDWSVGVQAGGLLLLLGDGRELHVVKEGNFTPGLHVVDGVIVAHVVHVHHGGRGHALAVTALRSSGLLLLLHLPAAVASQGQLPIVYRLLAGLGWWWGCQFHNL